jgi:hypothetical protein
MGPETDNNSETSRYCLGCGYCLTGLTESRCPECGRTFTLEDNSTFADGEERARLVIFARRARRILLAIAAVIAFVVLEETYCDWGRRLQVCTNCGARSDVHTFEGFGVSLAYSTSVKEGPVSQFIQEMDGRACTHQWDSYGHWGGGLLVGWHGDGDGVRVWLLNFEHSFQSPKDLLKRRASTDPTFLPTFKDFVRTDDREKYQRFFDELYMWAASQASRPADEK